jgi:hypothetical protein
MTQYPILLNISVVSLLIPIFAGVYRLKILSRELKLLVIYIFLGFIIAIAINWFTDQIWTIILLHINTLVEYIFIMFIICAWQESRKMKRLLNAILWFYILFWLFLKFTFEPINGLFSITSSVSQVILALSAGYTLFVVIENYTQSLLQYQRFWILIALILNYTGTLIPTALGDVFFSQPGEASILLYSINWFLVIISNILFTIGILCPQTQQ